MARKKGKQRGAPPRILLIIGSSILAIGTVGGLVASLIIPRGPEASEARVALDPAIGPEDAPVEIVEYSDFGCSSCRAWHNSGIRERIIETYGDQVRFVYKDFPAVSNSTKPGEAGQCAFDQDMFWEFHDYVFENYRGVASDHLAYYALMAGLDVQAFQMCLGSGYHRVTVRSDWNEARSLGFRGTPSFIVNGEPLAGSATYEALSAAIDEALSTQ
jgi:protein-disulfide isomerase